MSSFRFRRKMTLFAIDDPSLMSFWLQNFITSPQAVDGPFELNVDMSHFKPEEISIQLTEGNVVVIEGKHEEKRDEDGSISGHFVKKCAIPNGFDVAKIETKLLENGILTVRVPKIENNKGAEEGEVRSIPVTRVKGFDVAKIETKLLEDGILTVRVPKIENNKGVKEGEIKSIPVTRAKGKGFWQKSKL